jgi:hypothetical protein
MIVLCVYVSPPGQQIMITTTSTSLWVMQCRHRITRYSNSLKQAAFLFKWLIYAKKTRLNITYLCLCSKLQSVFKMVTYAKKVPSECALYLCCTVGICAGDGEGRLE